MTRIKLAEFMKEAEGERFKIERITLSPQDVAVLKVNGLKTMTIHESYDMLPGSYMRLFDKQLKECVMSDTPMEQRTNREVISRARGDVLVAGLGLGMILRPMIASSRVRSVTVVEKHSEVIDLNMLAGFDVNHSKLCLINADIFKWHVPEQRMFDVIYFDIWNSTGQDNKPGMDALHERFKKHLRPKGWMESWRRADCQENLNPETKRFYKKLIEDNQDNPAIIGLLSMAVHSEVKCGGVINS